MFKIKEIASSIDVKMFNVLNVHSLYSQQQQCSKNVMAAWLYCLLCRFSYIQSKQITTYDAVTEECFSLPGGGGVKWPPLPLPVGAHAFLFISQGSALADLRYGYTFDHRPLVNLCLQQRKIIIIGQYLPKLCSNEKGSSFLTHSV